MNRPRNQIEAYLQEREARRRRRELWAIAGIALVLALLFLLESFFFDFTSEIGPSNLLFFGLVNLNIILACVLLFLVLRNITKLLFERRRKVLGARLRTRLVVAFTAFALVPTILLFYVAMSFISNSIERWFSLEIESSLNESLEVGQWFYEKAGERSMVFAKEVADELVDNHDFHDWTVRARRPGGGKASAALSALLEERRKQMGVDSIDVFASADGQPLTARAPGRTKRDLPRPESEFLRKGFAKETVNGVTQTDAGELTRGLAPIAAPGGGVQAVAIVTYRVPEDLSAKLRHIQSTFEDYRQLRLFRSPIRTSYFIILALISLFIFFSATWFGFYLARQITDPLQRLAEGARQVAAGEMDLRIEQTADDEIGTLVEAFNKMLDDLSLSRKELEEAMVSLESSNVELERRRASMEAVLNNVAAGVLSFDNEGRVLTVNPSAERILGVKANEALTKTWEDVFPAEFAGTFRRLAEEMTRGRRMTVQNQVEISVAGQQRTVLAIFSVIRHPPGAVLVVEDLTELLKAQRVAAWQEIARRIAHEIKNPLTPIQLAAQRLRKRYGQHFEDAGDSVFNDSTGVIVRQVEEMKHMVEEFSDFARLAEAKPRPTELADVLREVVILFGEGRKNITFETEIDGAVPRLMVDREQIKRVLINIVDNAVAAIHGKGTVTLRMQRLAEDRVRLEVADTGAGLPQTYRGRLFEPYFSTKKMGTGLGLAIVHRIVMDHGGEVSLVDNQPQGTLVRIDLPIKTIEGPAPQSDEGHPDLKT